MFSNQVKRRCVVVGGGRFFEVHRGRRDLELNLGSTINHSCLVRRVPLSFNPLVI